MTTNKTSEYQRQSSIFISHSSKDVVVARAVRNLLEDRNHNFVELIGLASYTTRSDVEVYKMLEDEIKARDWLVLVDSANSRNSPYVQFEIETAKSLKKPFYTINCDQFITGKDRYAIEQSLLPCVETFSKSLRIFISYSRRDEEFVKPLSYELKEHKFEVWQDTTNIAIGMNWQDELEKAIQDTVANGVMLILVSKASLQSPWVQSELTYAAATGGIILPVALENIDYHNLPLSLRPIQFLDVSQITDLEKRIQLIIKRLTDLRHRRFREACGGDILNV